MIVLVEYIFIHAKKGGILISDKLSAKKLLSVEVQMNLFKYKKSNLQKNTKKNICESVTYDDDLVNIS